MEQQNRARGKHKGTTEWNYKFYTFRMACFDVAQPKAPNPFAIDKTNKSVSHAYRYEYKWTLLKS